MPKRYIRDDQGNLEAIVDFFCVIEDGKTTVEVKDNSGYSYHTLKAYWRPERTWDDHMGNTPFGHFFLVPINGKRRRVYYQA